MSPPVWFLICSTPFVLVVVAWMCGRKASYHRGAASSSSVPTETISAVMAYFGGWKHARGSLVG